jgi:hypothetical protein
MGEVLSWVFEGLLVDQARLSKDKNETGAKLRTKELAIEAIEMAEQRAMEVDAIARPRVPPRVKSTVSTEADSSTQVSEVLSMLPRASWCDFRFSCMIIQPWGTNHREDRSI